MGKKKAKAVELPMSVDSEGLLETKLTRSEAIELMIEEAREQAEAQEKALNDEVSALQRLTARQVLEFVNAAQSPPRLDIPYWGTGTTSLTVTLEAEEQPKWLVELRERRKELHDKQRHLSDVRMALQDRGKAKLAIMKQVLEATEEGRDFLERISKMSIALKDRMFEVASTPKVPLLKESTTVTVTNKVTITEG